MFLFDLCIVFGIILKKIYSHNETKLNNIIDIVVYEI